MTWSKKAPSRDGWYWWREDVSRVPIAVEISGGTVYGTGMFSREPFHPGGIGGEWYSRPIKPPPGGDAVENCCGGRAEP